MLFFDAKNSYSLFSALENKDLQKKMTDGSSNINVPRTVGTNWLYSITPQSAVADPPQPV